MIKTKVNYLYECSFKSSKGKRHLLVCTESFGRAAALANSIASCWEDSDAYELYLVHLQEVVIVNA